jgi:hypothetical protein
VSPRTPPGRPSPFAFIALAALLGFGGAADAGRRHGAGRQAVIVVGTPRVVRSPKLVDGRPQGVLDLNVRPRTTAVWVDGRLRGTCAAFDGQPGKLHLAPGLRDVRLVTPDGVRVTRQLRVRAGVELNLSLDLR